MSDPTQKLPLFPLGSVLFPGATMSLHIFEERYRQMIGRCLADQTPFGVVLLREGEEVEEGRALVRAAEPHEIGTVARISASVRLDDGRYLLTAVGQERFRINYVSQRAPYIVAAVTTLPDPIPPGSAPTARDLRLTYERYWRGIAAATGTEAQAEELPPDIAAMSYMLADRLQVTMARKQHWLEVDLVTRMREMAAVLRTELALMPRLGSDGRTSPGGSLN